MEFDRIEALLAHATGEAVARAKRLGAVADAYGEGGIEVEVKVHHGRLEDMKRAVSLGIGIRAIVDGRLGFASSSDLSDAGVRGLAEAAVTLAKEASPDVANAIAEASSAAPAWHLDLFDPQVAALDFKYFLDTALAMEAIVRAHPGITRMESTSAGSYTGCHAFASSRGVHHAAKGTQVFAFCNPVAGQDGQIQQDYWYDARRHLAALEAPEAIATRAAERTVARLGARKMPSARVPVVFNPYMAMGFAGALTSALHGSLIYKKASFLVDKLGQAIAAPTVTLWDDPAIPQGMGSAHYDGEGVPTVRRALIENGVLRSYLHNLYSAAKCQAAPTGNASRSYAGSPGIGTHNLVLEAGARSPEAIMGEISEGFYVTSMMGRGADPVTGDYSRGASGFWIRQGKLAEPVQEMTVAGGLPGMLQAIDALGNDLTWRGSAAAPTLRFRELAVSGN